MSANKPHVHYTPELADEICEAVQTQSLNKYLRDNAKSGRLPTIQAVYNWFARYPEFKKKYIEARTLRALYRVEELDDIKENMKNGLMDYNIARVWIDATKWQAGKENQGLFGDKVTAEEQSAVTHVIRWETDK